jgi:hypothetical protein
MDIQYLKRRSEFLAPCESVIRAQRQDLDAGEPIRVIFAKLEKGYPGKVTVVIRSDNPLVFDTNWGGASDPTRFPARIKAAATALRECGLDGSFDIEHEAGELVIQKH